MFQRTQFCHHSHQARIPTLNPDFLPYFNFLPFVNKHLVDFVVLWSSGRTNGDSESIAKIEARK